jgi:peptidoglycan/LPS O-acetylase OafA/YrhL
MRAIAVLTVFANHLFDWPPGGFVGVDVFFVLSGFFITGLLIRERTTTGSISFSDFYVRRVKRILPSALLVLVVTVIGSYLLLPEARAKSALVDALYASLFASNFRFEAVGADYFQQDLPPSPLLHYWSLSIEEQFYFVWPFLLFAIFALTRGLRLRGKVWAREMSLFGAMAAIVIASFGWATHLSGTDPNSAYFSSFTRVWELGVGALVAIAGPWLARMPSSIRPALAYAGLAGVLASLFLINPTSQFPAPWAALPVFSTALVVASFHGADVRAMAPLTNPVARWFGDTSYTLYLWHWPVIILLSAILPKGLLFYAIAISLSLALTTLTYRYYENPIRKSNWLLEVYSDEHSVPGRLPKPDRSTWAAMGAAAGAGIAILILFIHQNEKSKASLEAETSYGQMQEQVATPDNASTSESPTASPCCKERNPEVPLQPSIDDYSKDFLGWRNPCWTDRQSPQLKTCDFGSTAADAKRIALVGDSHALSMLPAFLPKLDANNWRLTTYIGRECYLMEPVPIDGCREAMAKARADLREKKYDLVVVSSRRRNGLDVSEFQTAWDELTDQGGRIAVIADNPVASKESFECLTRSANLGGNVEECSTPASEALKAPDTPLAAAAVARRTSVIDFTEYYCSPDRCPSVIGDVIVYRDPSHITATFAKTLAQPLQEGIRKALSQ